MFGFHNKNNVLTNDKVYNWKETFEIDGMKFIVGCHFIGSLTYEFIAYNKDNLPVANTSVRRDKVPTIDEFEEIAKLSVVKIKKFIIRDYIPFTFVELDASKVHKKSEEKEYKNKAILKRKWQTFVTSIIRKAADKGEYEVCIGHLMPGDNIFEDEFDREIMLVDTPKILQERGFKVDVSVNENNPKAFIMTISWK